MRLYQDFDTPVMLWLTVCYKTVKFCEVFNLHVKFYFVNFVELFLTDENLKRVRFACTCVYSNRAHHRRKAFSFITDYRYIKIKDYDF